MGSMVHSWDHGFYRQNLGKGIGLQKDGLVLLLPQVVLAKFWELRGTDMSTE